MSSTTPTTNDVLDQKEAAHAINNYTRVANMLVDGYTELHPQDKWLFVCLDRLCGKEKNRYLSLRYISKRTGFSPSVLSDNKKDGKPGMIKRLHDAGLIHAEIKRRITNDGDEEKNAQYHITITDTWALNYAFYNGATRSESEQATEEESKPVLIPNKPVLKQNGKVKTCSDSEQTCSDSGTIVRLQDKITDSSKITEQENDSPNASPSATLSSSSDSDASHTQRILAMLQDENAQLKAMIAQLTSMHNSVSAVSTDEHATPPRQHVDEYTPDEDRTGALPTQGRGIVEPMIPDEASVHIAPMDTRNDASSEPTPHQGSVQDAQNGVVAVAISKQAELSSVTPHVEPVKSVAEKVKPTIRTSKKVVAVPVGPPELPGDDAVWNAETIVQIHEAHQGRRYPNGAKRAANRVRDKELAASEDMLLMTDIWESDNTAENRRRLLKIIIRQETRKENWWLETNGHITPHQLVEKDRIHQMVDELKRMKQEKRANFQSISGQRNYTYQPELPGEQEQEQEQAKPLPYTIMPQVSQPRIDATPIRPSTRRLTLRRPVSVTQESVAK